MPFVLNCTKEFILGELDRNPLLFSFGFSLLVGIVFHSIFFTSRRLNCCRSCEQSPIFTPFFFFGKMKLKSMSHVKCQNSHTSRPACRSSFTTSWEAGTSPSTPPASRKSSNEAKACCCTSQNSSPAQSPRLLHSLPQDVRLTSGLRFGQEAQEPLSFLRPASHFACQDNQASSRGGHKFRVGSFFPPSSCEQHCSVDVRNIGVG